MKKIVSAVLIIAVAFAFSSCGVKNEPVAETTEAATTEALAVPGENSDYTFIEYVDHIELTSYKGSATYLVLPQVINNKRVTGFGETFRGSLSLVTLIIPDTYESIEPRAFYECYKLTSVQIGKGVTSIGLKAFFGCQALETAYIPATVTTIAPDAFQYCNGLIIYGVAGSAAQAVADNYMSIYFREVKSADEITTEESTEPSTEREESTDEESTAG